MLLLMMSKEKYTFISSKGKNISLNIQIYNEKNCNTCYQTEKARSESTLSNTTCTYTNPTEALMVTNPFSDSGYRAWGLGSMN